MVWAFGSMTFVYFYMSFHLSSFFLSAVALLTIVCSMPLSMVLYWYIFQIDYYSSLHVLVLFIVIGIGADDVFVFVDAWKQSAAYPGVNESLEKRMAYTFRRAAKAMAVTSSTTAVAFLANAFSKLMPVKAFGLWAAILIPVNYILIILLFPAFLAFWERKVRDKCCVCKRCCKCCCKNQKVQDSSRAEHEKELEKEMTEQEKINLKYNKLPGVERFFANFWNRMIYLGKIPLVLIFLIFGCVAIYRASLISPLT